MQPEEQQFYALEKLAASKYTITLAVHEMPELRQKLNSAMNVNKKRAKNRYEELEKMLLNLIDALICASRFLLEMEEQELASYAIKLTASVKAFRIMTPDYTKICSVLNDFIKRLPSENQTTNSKIIGRLMNRVKLGYYPTDSEHISHIVQSIAFPPETTTNLFDPCCGCGIALRTLAEGNNCFTYGVELDESRAEEALTRLHRVGVGSFFYSRISNEAFHAMLLNPPYLSVLSEGGQNFRSEKRFLGDSLYHLMIDGLLIYIIPYYRLTEDVCRVICDNFKDITVWKFYGDEFKRFHQVAVMGIRQKRQSNEKQALALASSVLQIENIPALNTISNGRYSLPKEAKKVDLFKGAEFNVAELANQLKNSSSFTKLFQKNKLDTMYKRPLLPLSIGQIGLIGGSGLINGFVDCDAPHIIKGRIVKVSSTREEEVQSKKGDKAIEVHETTSNKLIFNVLTPHGFKSLS